MDHLASGDNHSGSQFGVRWPLPSVSLSLRYIDARFQPSDCLGAPPSHFARVSDKDRAEPARDPHFHIFVTVVPGGEIQQELLHNRVRIVVHPQTLPENIRVAA